MRWWVSQENIEKRGKKRVGSNLPFSLTCETKTEETYTCMSAVNFQAVRQ